MKKFFGALCALLFPAIASAHEVYVLSPQEIQTGIATPAFSEWNTAAAHMHQFIFWAFIAVVAVSTVFFVSLWHRVERLTNPFFDALRPYAPMVGRVTIGLSLLAAAYYNALFGPELPLDGTFGSAAIYVRIALVVISMMLIFDMWAREAALVLLALFCVEIFKHSAYMFTYANYFGEAVALVVLGTALGARARSYAFLAARVCFGAALLYASFYAKILHNDLALQVASLPLAGHAHSIAYYLGFEPHFLVLGAAIIEVVVAVFFILGIEIRWTSIFMLFWLSLSLWYFGESVWPHVVLIGLPLSFICYGYDRFTLEGYFFHKR